MKRSVWFAFGCLILCLLASGLLAPPRSQAQEDEPLVSSSNVGVRGDVERIRHSPSNLPQNVVRAVTCDQSGYCWFPTWGGVGVYAPEDGWTDFTTSNSGIAHSYCYDVGIDAAGRVWITHHSVGVSLLDYNGTLFDKTDDTWLTFTPTDGLGSSWVNTVTIDSQGDKWFGHSSGISVLDDNGTPFNKADDTWTNYADPGLNMVNAILFDPDGCVWAGTDWGLRRNCDDTWEEITWPGKPGCFECCWIWPRWVWELALDDQGHVWVADGACGAAEWDGSEWAICDTADAECGLPPDDDGQDSGARALAIDRHNNKWFGTRGRGVARLNSFGEWTLFTTDEDWLGSNQIEGLDFDLRGHGWFGTWGSGTFEYIPASATSGAVLPASGGEVTSPDGSAKASFPPGAVDQPTTVTYSKASASPTGDLFGARFFDLSAIISGTTTPVTSTNKPYTITVNYTDREKGVAIENTLRLYWWEGGQWTLEPTSSVDMANNRLTAHPDHMTLFAVLGETKRVYLPLVLR